MKDLIYRPDMADSWLDTRQSAYLIHGSDARTLSDVVEKIIGRWIRAEDADFDLDRLDAAAVPIADIVSSLQREPVLGDVRIVVIKSCAVLRDLTSDANRLAAAIQQLGDRAMAVLVKEEQSATSKSASTVLTSRLDAAIRSVGMVVSCPELSETVLVRWMIAYAGAADKKLEPHAAKVLYQRRGGDRISLSLELDKVIALVGEREPITQTDVEMVLAHDPEDVMFGLVDAVAERRTGEALVLLRSAARYETRSHALAGKFLTLLTRRLRLLYQALELRSEGIRPGDLKRLPDRVVTALPAEGSITSMAWRGNALWTEAARWSRSEVVHALEMVMDCDAANKGEDHGSDDPMTNLEVLIAGIGEPVRRKIK